MARKKTNAVAAACVAAGSQRALSTSLGVTEQAVCLWVKQGWVPVRRAQEIEALTGVPRGDLINPRLLDLIAADASL